MRVKGRIRVERREPPPAIPRARERPDTASLKRSAGIALAIAVFALVVRRITRRIGDTSC